MLHPQYIKPPGGEKMVILLRKEYEQLCEAVEDADCIRVYGEAKRRLSAGEDEMVPSEFATVSWMAKTRFGFGANIAV